MNIKKLSIALLIMILTVCCLVGCKQELVALSTPTVTVEDNGVARWDSVEGATRYCYEIGGVETLTDKRSLVLMDGQSIRVKAIGDGKNNKDSEYSEYVSYVGEMEFAVDGYKLSWRDVSTALGYDISVEGDIYNGEKNITEGHYETFSTDNGIDLSGVLSPATEYSFTLTVIMEDGGEGKSAVVSGTTEKVTAGLSYTLNSDGQSYTVDRGTVAKTGRIVFPDTYEGLPITKIADKAFGTDGLKNNGVTGYRLPLGLKEVGNESFRNCNPTEIILPKTLKKIGESAFFNCERVTSLVLPEGLEHIGTTAFREVGAKSVTLPNSLKTVGTSAFNFSQIESVSAGNNIEYMGTRAFLDTPWEKNLPEGFVYVGNVLYTYKGENTELVLPAEATVLAAAAFIYQTALQSVTLAEGTKVIPESCFFDCSSLHTVNVPDSVTAIEYSAFSGCSSLKQISLPASVTSLGDAVFYESGLTSFVLPRGVAELHEFAFSFCKDLASVQLHDGVTKIGANAFQRCSSLTEIVIPEGVEVIEYAAFVLCTNLKSVSLPSSLTEITESMFAGCTSLEEIDLPRGVTKLERMAFTNSGLKEINLLNVKEIGDNAFYSCTNLTKVVTSQLLTSVGEKAFAECINLSEINLPDSLTVLGGCAFENTKALVGIISLKNISIVETKVFSGCSLVTGVVLNKNVTQVRSNAFDGVGDGFVVYYLGGETDESLYYDPFSKIPWSKIKDFLELKGIKVYFYSASQPTVNGDYWYYDTDGKITVWKKEQ